MMKDKLIKVLVKDVQDIGVNEDGKYNKFNGKGFYNSLRDVERELLEIWFKGKNEMGGNWNVIMFLERVYSEWKMESVFGEFEWIETMLNINEDGSWEPIMND